MPVTTGLLEYDESQEVQWKLGQNFPNPFNGRTMIPVELSADDDLSIRFFDSLGRFVSELPLGRVGKGSHNFQWDGTDINGSPLASGLYYCVVQNRHRSSVKKLVFLK
jgi:flagellar hook assembly protein FlgD